MKRFLIPLLIILVTLVSCNDAKYAGLLEGTWSRSSVISYEDGTKSHQDEYISFKKVGDDDGGTFTEVSTGQEEFDEDGVNGTYRWVSYIEGNWEIIFGTIYFKYDISSLEVKVGKDDVKYELDHSQAFKYGLESGFSSLFDLDYILGADFYLSENLYKEIQKESYRDLFRYYKNMNQQYDDGLGYKNLKVDNYTMSYSAEDGDYTYHRYNSSVPSVK